LNNKVVVAPNKNLYPKGEHAMKTLKYILQYYPLTIITIFLSISLIISIFIEGKVYAAKEYCHCNPYTCTPSYQTYECDDTTIQGHEQFPRDSLKGCVCKGPKSFQAYIKNYFSECEKKDSAPLLGCCDNAKNDCGKICDDDCGKLCTFIPYTDDLCPANPNQCTGECKNVDP